MKSITTLLLGVSTLFAPLTQAAPSASLVNPNANSDAKALISFLLKNYGSRTLSGQQDKESTDWVINNIKKTPAITGFDFMDYSPSRVAHGTNPGDVEEALAWGKRGGIVKFVWHWGSPSGSYDSSSQPWYSNFYTAATSFDVGRAMNNPGSSDYNLLVRDIDVIAKQLLRLQAAGIPVLWRPLHEAEGTWFWWGAKGSDACKKLWNLMYDRMTNYHKLNNLIWMWNSDKPEWYPGNNRVDIVSTDIYASAGDHNPQQGRFDTLKKLCGDSKIIALAESGVIPTFSKSAPWSLWVVWTDAYINNGNWNSRSFLNTIYNTQETLTLEEISGWKNGGGTTNPPVTTAKTTAGGQVTTRATTANSGGGGAPLYGQCGGNGYTGPKNCAQGTCKWSNEWYSQCL